MLGGAASHPSEERRRRMWQDVLIRTRGVKQRRGEENLLLEKSFYFRGKSKGKSYKLLHPKLFFTVTAQNFLHDGLRPKHFSDLLPRYEPPNLSGLRPRGQNKTRRCSARLLSITRVLFEFLLCCFYIFS